MRHGDPKFKTFIINLLRKGTYKWSPRTRADMKSRVTDGGYRFPKDNNRSKIKHKCVYCELIYHSEDVQLDHVDPVVSVEDGFVDFDVYIKRLYCVEEGFQKLCWECHEIKTFLEDQLRKDYRYERNHPEIELALANTLSEAQNGA